MDPNEQMRQAFQHIGPAIFLFWGVIYLVKVTLYVIPMWQTCKKAGLAGPIALVAFVPLIGRLIVNYIIAFSDWKVGPVAASYPTSYAPPPTYYPPQNPTL